MLSELINLNLFAFLLILALVLAIVTFIPDVTLLLPGLIVGP